MGPQVARKYVQRVAIALYAADSADDLFKIAGASVSPAQRR